MSILDPNFLVDVTGADPINTGHSHSELETIVGPNGRTRRPNPSPQPCAVLTDVSSTGDRFPTNFDSKDSLFGLWSDFNWLAKALVGNRMLFDRSPIAHTKALGTVRQTECGFEVKFTGKTNYKKKIDLFKLPQVHLQFSDTSVQVQFHDSHLGCGHSTICVSNGITLAFASTVDQQMVSITLKRVCLSTARGQPYCGKNVSAKVVMVNRPNKTLPKKEGSKRQAAKRAAQAMAPKTAKRPRASNNHQEKCVPNNF
eukprot:TRINITY_DN67505_c2_g2_i3.p1 TRINITY_DN67505_c2_g2~~TRINITY_DN67505_c2_g2_i3.p1  ORF type:complete len:256 (+),score=-10.52 TRINITY_DN67505_c2_g2_i3:53-820(+)